MERKVTAHSDKDRPTAFGTWMTEKREAAGMFQHELAPKVSERVGRFIHSGRMSEYEQGQRVPPADVVAALHELLDPTGPPPPAPEKAPKAEKEETAAAEEADSGKAQLSLLD